MPVNETQFSPGDSEYDIARKILFTLGENMNDPQNDPRPGDTMAVLLRKILARIGALLP